MADFQEELLNPQTPTNEEIIQEIEADNEKEYLRELKKKNKGYLVEGLSVLEKERIAQYIVNRYNESMPAHKELCEKWDEKDRIFRMERKELPGSDGDMPNYVTPLSTVTCEVVHANIMNVFFTPKDILRVLPTEENDVPKVQKVDRFGNWSIKNELDVFTQADRLFHSSIKNGECPYILHWVKEYGTVIERTPIMNPANPTEPLIDPDTERPIFQEVDKQQLTYNGPKLETFSRKDYIQPKNATMDGLPEWEMRRIRYTYDDYLREELQGKMFDGTIKDVMGWGYASEGIEKIDFEGDSVPLGEWEQEFVEYYGRMRINVVKKGKENEADEYLELEDEVIAVVNIKSNVLCSLRYNKFPLKMRPIGMDYFIPDDEGRRAGLGVMDMMAGPQSCYDALYNQYLFGTVQSNNPVVFFTPIGNMRNEPIKLKNGYMYPTSDTNSVKMFQFPQPNESLSNMMEQVSYWAQLLFGISDYSAGMESKIDPSAPAKKAEIVVQQGNVRLNMIIKRKNKTLQDIFRRWFLLYKENMPKNKFMRIAGTDKDNPWKFESVTLEDFALKSIPDFELTGNVLNANKNLEVNKSFMIYNVLIRNPYFSPQTRQGLQALHALTKWIMDKVDETGISRFLPAAPGKETNTPEEENALFLQGDQGLPAEGEDHIKHIQTHRMLLNDMSIPDEVKRNVMAHIKETIKLIQQQAAQQMVMGGPGGQVMPQGGANAVTGRGPQGPNQASQGVFPQQTAGMAGY